MIVIVILELIWNVLYYLFALSVFSAYKMHSSIRHTLQHKWVATTCDALAPLARVLRTYLAIVASSTHAPALRLLDIVAQSAEMCVSTIRSLPLWDNAGRPASCDSQPTRSESSEPAAILTREDELFHLALLRLKGHKVQMQHHSDSDSDTDSVLLTPSATSENGDYFPPTIVSASDSLDSLVPIHASQRPTETKPRRQSTLHSYNPKQTVQWPPS